SPVLAAMNPVGGRYDPSKTLQRNVHISAPLLSRFDLFFVLRDDANEETDRLIAKKVVSLHCGDQDFAAALSPDEAAPFTVDQLKRYLAVVKTLKPRMTTKAAERLAAHYNRLRQADMLSASRRAFRITVRQLESLIRLSEAIAKLLSKDNVDPEDVDLAAELVRKSAVRVEAGGVTLEPAKYAPVGRAALNKALAAAGTVRTPDVEASESSDEDGAKRARGEREDVVTVSFEEYTRVTNLAVLFIKQHVSDHEEAGMTEGALVNKLLEAGCHIVPDDPVRSLELLRTILARLITIDRVLVLVENGEEEPLIDVHTRYVGPEDER
ncbi:DNA replication licensing factor Mcm6, partial [Kipferlia bialata]